MELAEKSLVARIAVELPVLSDDDLTALKFAIEHEQNVREHQADNSPEG